MPSEITERTIESLIFILRGHRIMLDTDLARLYGVTTFNLNKTVKRNHQRFPKDFMFQLTKTEYENLIFQFGISKSRHGGRRFLPFAFTQEGVAMLSSVLRSPRAISVNIAIMRVFVKLRTLFLTQREMVSKLEQIEKEVRNNKKTTLHNSRQIKIVFEIIHRLLDRPRPPIKIGFKP